MPLMCRSDRALLPRACCLRAARIPLGCPFRAPSMPLACRSRAARVLLGRPSPNALDGAGPERSRKRNDYEREHSMRGRCPYGPRNYARSALLGSLLCSSVVDANDSRPPHPHGNPHSLLRFRRFAAAMRALRPPSPPAAGYREQWRSFKRRFTEMPDWAQEHAVIAWTMTQMGEKCMASAASLPPLDRKEFPMFQNILNCLIPTFANYAGGRGANASMRLDAKRDQPAPCRSDQPSPHRSLHPKIPTYLVAAAVLAATLAAAFEHVLPW